MTSYVTKRIWDDDDNGDDDDDAYLFWSERISKDVFWLHWNNEYYVFIFYCMVQVIKSFTVTVKNHKEL